MGKNPTWANTLCDKQILKNHRISSKQRNIVFLKKHYIIISSIIHQQNNVSYKIFGMKMRNRKIIRLLLRRIRYLIVTITTHIVAVSRYAYDICCEKYDCCYI